MSRILFPPRRERDILGKNLMIESVFHNALRYVDFTKDDAARLRASAPLFRPYLPELAERFYTALLSHPEAVRIFSGPAQIERLRSTLQRWAEELLTSPRDLDYAEKRRGIGTMHVQIDLDQRYVIGAMGRIRDFLQNLARTKGGPEGTALALSVGRACDLDLMLITEAYHDAARLRDLSLANERLRRLLEQAPVAVFGFDPEGRIREWNASAERLYGWPREEILGRSVFETLVLPEDEKLVREMIRRVYDGEAIGPLDRRHRTRDGRLLRMVLAHAPIRWTGLDAARRDAARVEEAYAFCLDVTELEVLRGNLIEREKRTALGTLAAGLAHEVGNPLASISAICQLIEKKGPDERLGERIRTIRESIDRIDGMVRRVLEFARTRRESDEEPISVDLAEASERVRALVALHRGMKGIVVEDEIPEGLRVRAPRAGLEQVLLNLLLNAAEATGDGGSVALRAKEENGAVSMIIEDDGPGFDAEALRRATEPFYTTKEDGTGLGLAISFGIVERAGGTLRYENRPSPARGSRVTITLPGV